MKMLNKHARTKQSETQAETPPTFFRAKLEQLESRTLLSLNLASQHTRELVRHVELSDDFPVAEAFVTPFHQLWDWSSRDIEEHPRNLVGDVDNIHFKQPGELAGDLQIASNENGLAWSRFGILPESPDTATSFHRFDASNTNGIVNPDDGSLDHEEPPSNFGWQREDGPMLTWKGDWIDARPNLGFGETLDFGPADRPLNWTRHDIDPITDPPTPPSEPPPRIDLPLVVVLPTGQHQGLNVSTSPARTSIEFFSKPYLAGRHESTPFQATPGWHDPTTLTWNDSRPDQADELCKLDAILPCVETNPAIPADGSIRSNDPPSDSPEPTNEYVEAARDLAAAGAFAVMLAPPLSRLLAGCPIMTIDSAMNPWQILWAWVRRRKAKRPAVNDAPNDEPADDVAAYEPIEAAILDLISSAADKSLKVFRENSAMAMAASVCAGGAAVATVWGSGEFRGNATRSRKSNPIPAAPVDDGTTHLAGSLT